MNRPFTADDDGKLFHYMHRKLGRLEFPLEDPGTATPDEGIIWFLTPVNGYGWEYVKPADVDIPADWELEGNSRERPPDGV